MDKKSPCEETELSKLLAKSARDMLDQKTKYEQLLSDLKLKLSLELNKVKDDNDSLRKKVQFLQVCRNSLSGDIYSTGRSWSPDHWTPGHPGEKFVLQPFFLV